MTKHWYRPSTWNYPRAYGAILALIVFFGILLYVADRQNASDLNAQRNKEAIQKGCILLNNAIIESSTASQNPNSPSAALIAGILQVIPPKYVKLFAERSQKQGPVVIPLINCEEVANHPDSIRAIQLHPPHTTPVPSQPPIPPLKK